MHLLALLASPGVLPVVTGVAVTVITAVMIRLFWRPRTTPWDA